MIGPKEILESRLLIVDDQAANTLLLERMLRGAGYRSIRSTSDPTEVCALHRENRYDLILLDLLMPVLDGFGVMEGLREVEGSDFLPVLVLTAQPGHKLRALEAGAQDFLCKPLELPEVLARVRNLLEMRLLQRRLREDNDSLAVRVKERTLELAESYLETIFAMTRAAEHKDEDTGAHVLRISAYSRDLATMLGRDAEFCDRIYFASPMHDVGKIGIPDHILLKSSSFTPDEWEIMKLHPVMGAKILGNSRSPYLQMAAEIALGHHERWDGGGYPAGLAGDAIPISARVMNICDVYDALRSRRPYKPALGHREAVDIITRGDGRTEPAHFDPVILEAFRRNHEVFETTFATLALAA